MNPDLQKAYEIRREYNVNRQVKLLNQLREFLHRFINAANSHVELEPFVVEGEKLLRDSEYCLEDDGTAAE